MYKKLISYQYYFLFLSLFISCISIGITNTFWSLFAIIITSSISVYIHEFGHYIAAKSFGYTPLYFIAGVVNKNGLHYFNALFKFRLFGTYFILNPFAQGGSTETFTYMHKEPRFKMAIISFAGPFTNLIFGLIVFLLNFKFLKSCYEYGIIDVFNKTDNDKYLLVILVIFISLGIVYFIYNLLPIINSSDGWFIKQLYKNEKEPDFYNIDIHKKYDKSLTGEDSFREIIKPIYESNSSYN